MSEVTKRRVHNARFKAKVELGSRFTSVALTGVLQCEGIATSHGDSLNPNQNCLDKWV